MITEDYVSFETAKLLKEKGFDGRCHMSIGKNEQGEIRAKGTEWDDSFILCPTLQMATKWLREEKHIFVELSVDTMIKSAITWRLFEFPSLIMMPYEGWEYNYEDACEAAIKYCLENLI